MRRLLEASSLKSAPDGGLLALEPLPRGKNRDITGILRGIPISALGARFDGVFAAAGGERRLSASSR